MEAYVVAQQGMSRHAFVGLRAPILVTLLPALPVLFVEVTRIIWRTRRELTLWVRRPVKRNAVTLPWEHEPQRVLTPTAPPRIISRPGSDRSRICVSVP